MVKGPGVRGKGRGDLGVRFDRLNELRGEAGKVLEPAVPEPVEGSKGRGRRRVGERWSPGGSLRPFDPSTSSGHRKFNELRVGKVPELVVP